jgi:hypothetical protein
MEEDINEGMMRAKGMMNMASDEKTGNVDCERGGDYTNCQKRDRLATRQ